MDPLSLGIIGAIVVALVVKNASRRPPPVREGPVSFVQSESPLRTMLRPPVTERMETEEDEGGGGSGGGLHGAFTSANPDVAGQVSQDGGGTSDVGSEGSFSLGAGTDYAIPGIPSGSAPLGGLGGAPIVKPGGPRR